MPRWRQRSADPWLALARPYRSVMPAFAPVVSALIIGLAGNAFKHRRVTW
jgi:hypothetical protein